MRARLKVFKVGILIALVLIFSRVVQVQYFYGDRLQKMARSQEREIELQGPRGKIRDRQGRELASSVESYSFFLDPSEVEKPKSFSQKVGAALKIPAQEILQKINQNKNKRFVWLKRQADRSFKASFENSSAKGLAGLGILREYRREYPHGDLLSQLIGRVSIDGLGIEGIERDYEKNLKAGVSLVKVPRDARGRLYYVDKDQLLTKGEPGKDVCLTIDLDLQSLVESKVDEYRQKYKADTALAIVVDAETNEIIVWSQSPRVYKKGGAPFRNFAATDPIEPGSVVKPLVLSWGIERQVINEKTRFEIPGGELKILDKTFKDPSAKKHPVMNAEEILKYSSNIGAIRMGQRMGFKDLWSFYEKLGFTQKSQLGLSGESRSIIRKPKDKQLVEQATMSFGQGFAVTPLQIVRAFQVIAGDGFLRPLQVIRSDEKAANPAGENVLNPRTLQRIRKLMQASLSDGGTAVSARVEGYSVAGKTGTSQKIKSTVKGEKGYSEKSYWTSFVGFLPSEDPRFLIYVAFDNPDFTSNTGGQTAAPLFSEIAKICLRGESNVPPAQSPADNITELASVDPEAVVAKQEKVNTAEQALIARDISSDAARIPNQIPSLMGLHVSEALELLDTSEYKVKIKGRGHYVSHQYPEPGTVLKKNKDVVLFVK